MPNETRIICQRCERQLRIEPTPMPHGVTMLRRSRTAQGFCVNCAVHDWLRNTYPCNMILAGMSSPHALLHPGVQQQFIGIMRSCNAEANPDEIEWKTIVEQWDLPFPTRIKRSATNPMNEEDLEQEKNRWRAYAPRYETMRDRAVTDGVMRSFDELNDIEPGLGDQLKEVVRGTAGKTGRGTPAYSPQVEQYPPRQLRLL